MKKIYGIGALALAAFTLLYSCDKSQEETTPLYDFSVEASIDDEGTKLAFLENMGQSGTVAGLGYVEGEQISAFIMKDSEVIVQNGIMTPSNAGVPLPYKTATLSGKFPVKIEPTDKISMTFISPYHPDNKITDAGEIKIVLPDKFIYSTKGIYGIPTVGNFYGSAEAVSTSMATQYALFRLPIRMEEAAGRTQRIIKHVKVRGNKGEIIAGPATYTAKKYIFDTNSPLAKKEITIDFEGQNIWVHNNRTRDIYFALPRLVDPTFLRHDPNGNNGQGMDIYAYYIEYVDGITVDFIFEDDTKTTLESKPIPAAENAPQSSRLTTMPTIYLKTPTAIQ